MIKLFGLFFFLCFSLIARENPFFPSEGEIDIPITTNIQEDIKPLKRSTITLPSTARVVEAVSITYKNLDGSVEQKTLKLNNSVDWHQPLVITQNYTSSSSESKEKKNITENRSTNSSSIKIDTLKFIRFHASNREFRLLTKDSMIRDFLLTKPHRVVCDFKRDINIRSYVNKIKNRNIFREFRVGNHRGYYRVVVELDGYYRYKMEKTKDGYLFKLL